MTVVSPHIDRAMKRVILLIYFFLVLAMAVATLVEQALGTSFAIEYIYHSPVFILLWGLLAVLTIFVFYKYRMWERTFVWMLHLSFIVILIGAGVSFLTSRKGQLHLRIGASTFRYMEQETHLMKDLPFVLKLDTFQIEYHPKTDLPTDYVSWVTCLSKEEKKTFSDRISMNRILTYQGYRFYLSSYDDDRRGSLFMVNYDPWGTPITYLGYFLFSISMLGILWNHRGDYRKLFHRPSSRRIMMLGILCFTGTLSYASSFVPLIQKEMVSFYHSIPFTEILLTFDLVCGFVSLIVMLVRILKKDHSFGYSFTLLLSLSLFLHLAVYLFRWYVGGHIPLGNGYETMLFLAVCVQLLVFGLRKWFPLVAPLGFFLAGFSLLVPIMMEMDTQISPLTPVLSSSWLCVHVSFVMVAYAFFCIMALNALLGLFLFRESRRLMLFGRLLLYPAMFFLGTGIFLGAMWANVSWGRYWAWDPKEVWALITFMVYGVAFHAESLPWFNRPRFFHLYILLAFLTLLMTYLGVNYLLGGMHSYLN